VRECSQALLSLSLGHVCRQLPPAEELFSVAALYLVLEFRSVAFLPHVM